MVAAPAASTQPTSVHEVDTALMTSTLRGCDAEELKEMGRRLGCSYNGLQQLLQDMKAEQEVLQSENQELNTTISMVMHQVMRLNIGPSNINEPELAEGPLDFIGRYWERVRPRSSVVTTSKHVSEIRKPQVALNKPTGQKKKGGRTLLEQLKKAEKRARRKATAAFNEKGLAFEDLSKKAIGQGQVFSNLVAEQLAEAKAFLQVENFFLKQGNAAKEEHKDEDNFSDMNDHGHASEQNKGEHSSSANDLFAFFGRRFAQDSRSKLSTVAPSPLQSPGRGVDPEQNRSAQARDDISPLTFATNKVEQIVKEEKLHEVVEQPTPESMDRLQSTTLIEVSLRLGDGSVELCEVRADDRCKDVAARFVREHSLKTWFEQPLKAFLMKAEAEAETFPVKMEADLMEIRREFSSAAR